MQPSADILWGAAQQQLRAMLNTDIYNLWFLPIKASTLAEDTLTLDVANDFCEVWLKDNYLGLIHDVLMQTSGQNLKVKFHVNPAAAGSGMLSAPDLKAKGKTLAEPVERNAPAIRESAFNPKNTFETFVVGENNNHAHAAAMAVAQSPGKSYNPLFFFSGVGLGKTHLLHAIGQYIGANKKGARVTYLSCEKFTNEYIDAIQNNQLVRFRRKYRQADVLLIDDVQFLAGKERIQEEFFHTFNALHEARKQIVMTCDRPAPEIQNLEHRLVSRFEWGLVAEMQPPDVETRMAIVRKKVPGVSKKLSEQVVTFVQALRKQDLFKSPGVAETLDWAAALSELDVMALDPATVSDTLGVLLKYQDDIARLEGTKVKELLDEMKSELRAAE